MDGREIPPVQLCHIPQVNHIGKVAFRDGDRGFSISLAHIGSMPQRTAASGNTPIPSNRLPSRSAVILSASLSLDGQYAIKGGGGDSQPLATAMSFFMASVTV